MTGSILPRSYCRHRLPISNGWSSSAGADGSYSAAVYCGRCREEIDVSTDTEWDARYLAARGYSPLAQVEESREYMRNLKSR